jgi:hypothetical protein
MRSPHRVLCAVALSALVAVSCFLYLEAREGTDAAARGWATRRGSPADETAPAGPRIDIPAVDDGSARLREGASRWSSEWLASREGEGASAERSRATAASSGERRDRESRPRPSELHPTPSSDPPIDFDRLSVAPEALSVAVTGVDWGAPRQLVLWRIEGERHARLAATRSLEGGRFDFGQVLVPNRGLELVVTALGAAPGPADRARSLALQPPDLWFAKPE